MNLKREVLPSTHCYRRRVSDSGWNMETWIKQDSKWKFRLTNRIKDKGASARGS